jgi:hypothetical protein
MNTITNTNTNTNILDITDLTNQEIFNLAMNKIHANVFHLETILTLNTIIVPDYKNILSGYILTNDDKLPEYQEKIKILNELIPGSNSVNEKCFLVYLIFFIFLFPETQLIYAINQVDKNQIKYYQILFKEIVEKLKLTKNKEIQRVIQGFPHSSISILDSESTQKLIKGGTSKKMVMIIIISLLYSVFISSTSLNMLLTKQSILTTKIDNNELKNAYNKLLSTVKDLTKLGKQPEFVYKVKKIENKYEKLLSNNDNNKNNDTNVIDKNINLISNILDTLKITNIFGSNNFFSFVIDSKKVGMNIYEILNKKYDFTSQNIMTLLGNISNLLLHASSCFNNNFLLVIESTNAFCSLSNVLGSAVLLNEIHKDAIIALFTFTKEQQIELINQFSFLGGKQKTKKRRSKKRKSEKKRSKKRKSEKKRSEKK